MSAEHVTEEFRPVTDWPLYRVSDLGRVQRMKTPGRKYPDPANFVWADCAIRVGPGGYLLTTLYANGRVRHYLVHRLVLEAFIGPCPPGMVGRHVLTNDRTDARLANLAWGTLADNARDKKRHGTDASGAKNPNAKLLTEEDVLEMRRLRLAGVPRGVIASRWGICAGTVSKMVYGGLWKQYAPTPECRALLLAAGYTRGDQHYKTKITSAMKEQAKQWVAEGLTGSEIGRRLGVEKSTGCRLVKKIKGLVTRADRRAG